MFSFSFFKKGSLSFALAWLVAAAHGQAFNIDRDIATDPELGGGPPSPQFGAASGQIGRWNSVHGGSGPFFLLDLDGNATSVQLRHPQRGNGGAWFNPDLQGDFRSLMADNEDMGAGLEYVLTGLESGLYQVWTYCGTASPGFFSETFVTVPGALGLETVRVAGTMPANEFIHLRTHSIHEALVSDGTLRILAHENWPTSRGFVAGMQLVLVPEPATLITFAAGIALLAKRRRLM